MRRRLRGAMVAVPLAFGPALVGCGSDGGAERDDDVPSVDGGEAPSGDGGSTAEQDPAEGRLAFARCMRENGVDMPDPRPGEEAEALDATDLDEETMNRAMEACRDRMPGGGGDLGGLGSATSEDLLQFAQCMRDAGFTDFPDPQERGLAIPEDIMRDSRFPEAQQDCQTEFLPGADLTVEQP
ncbi:hypothetical protein [Streptomyces hainanensis]|uniref:Lipoprotein n=1 Tax=Streptomyces hainanensis TaxID=402648 RepID=A0A4R4TYI9_9ACTN|nr:hypothetical protein [Streptomyces hainanensis]TDC79269.1 hypothetical protein E1283_03040 [Streptomyces hainanensis]